MVDEVLELRRIRQTGRIEKIVSGLLDSQWHQTTFVFSEEAISFCIDGDGKILLESYAPTPISEIERLNDVEIENQLRNRFLETEQLLNF